MIQEFESSVFICPQCKDENILLRKYNGGAVVVVDNANHDRVWSWEHICPLSLQRKLQMTQNYEATKRAFSQDDYDPVEAWQKYLSERSGGNAEANKEIADKIKYEEWKNNEKKDGNTN